MNGERGYQIFSWFNTHIYEYIIKAVYTYMSKYYTSQKKKIYFMIYKLSIFHSRFVLYGRYKGAFICEGLLMSENIMNVSKVYMSIFGYKCLVKVLKCM